MGFDLTGTVHNAIPEPNWDLGFDHPDIKQYFYNRDNLKGAYFRASCWQWRPIPVLVGKLGFLKTDEENNGWAYNDYYKVDKDEAKEIGMAILDWLDCMVQEYEIPEGEKSHYLINLEAKVMAEVEFTEVWSKLPEHMETCKLCDGTGDRTDGVIQGAWKKKCNGCNGCYGEGMVSKHYTSYATSLVHLQEFAEFAMASGGFKIG